METAVESPDSGEITCPDCGTIMKPLQLGDRRDPAPGSRQCPQCGRRQDGPPKK